MSDGKLITFEGIEGCGKTTQLRLLARHLEDRSLAVVTTREPGGTPLGERVRDLLLDPRFGPVAVSELFLLEAARSQVVAEVIRPGLDAGAYVLSDRFADSSVAYQAGARGIDRAAVERLNTTADNRRFEDEAIGFHRAVAAAYHDLARREPHRVVLVDARGTAEEVHARAVAAVGDLIP